MWLLAISIDGFFLAGLALFLLCCAGGCGLEGGWGGGGPRRGVSGGGGVFLGRVALLLVGG